MPCFIVDTIKTNTHTHIHLINFKTFSVTRGGYMWFGGKMLLNLA